MSYNMFACPLIDPIFKLVFGEKKNKQITIDFLNDILERTGQSNEIKDISFMHQELTPRKFDEKKSILDINCTDIQGHQFIIEIQRRKEDFFDQRIFSYAANLLSRQLQESDSYGKLKPVIVVSILNFQMYPNFSEPVSHHMMCDVRTGKQSMNLIEIHVIELGKFHKTVDQLITNMDKWLFFLKEAQKQHAIPAVYDDKPSIQKAFDVISQWNWTKEQMAAYDKELMYFRMQVTKELADEEKQSAAKEEGVQRGKIDIALKMLQKQMKIEEIADLTGLAIEDIKKL